jgi:SRSO17 transposase
VFLAYATEAGRALIDREVYLPKAWTEDRDRCRAAGVPDDVRFATKIALGRRMLNRALDANVPAAWATADEFTAAIAACVATCKRAVWGTCWP